MPTNAEEKVKRLAKKKSNTVCPNCGCEKKFGFGSVCIKFFTFVCNECKSSHQAISHRCKSTTMSSWTDEEVAELERKGNDYCRRTWLKNAPPEGSGGRPKPGMDINAYKRFVIEAYEHKRFYGEDDGPMPQVHIPTPTAAPVARCLPSVKKPTQVVALAQVSDLLDFSAPASSTPLAAPTPAPSIDLFADFTADSFPAPVAHSAVMPVSNDLFAATSSAFDGETSIPTLAKPEAFSSTTSTQPSTSSSSFSSDFEGLSAPSSGCLMAKKPIMGNGGTASAISMMGQPTMGGMNAMSGSNSVGGMSYMGGVHPNMMPSMQQTGMNHQMQQQQQYMMMQHQMMQMSMNGGMNHGMNGGMNHGMNGGMNNGFYGGMNNGMMNNITMMNSGMAMNGMAGGIPQQKSSQHKQLSMNSMPGGDVMATMGMLNGKKK